jgi:uracil-DNA glycosylase
MELSILREELTKRLPSADYRPFICHGSPLDCQVFIVGINPATEITHFWTYWNDTIGFDYHRWFEDYKKARRGKGKREISPTRRNLAIISEELTQAGIKALETNIYAKSTARANKIVNADKLTDGFDYLLGTIKPKLILLHGQLTVREISKKIQKPITGETKSRFNRFEVDIIPIQHLSYQFSKEKAKTVGQQIINKIRDSTY